MFDPEWTLERVLEAAHDARKRGGLVKISVGSSTYTFTGNTDAAEVTDA